MLFPTPAQALPILLYAHSDTLTLYVKMLWQPIVLLATGTVLLILHCTAHTPSRYD